MIRAVGDRLRRSIRLTDAAVRLGGDEFGVLLVDLPNAATAQRLATRIHAAVTAPIELDDRIVQVGASVGVYLLERTARRPSVARVHDLADREMFRAKQSGGGLRIAERRR